QRRAGIAAGYDLGQRRQVWRDSVETLRAAGRAAEPRNHFVEDEDNAVLGRDLPQIGQELRSERNLPEARAGRLDDDGGDIVTLLADRLHDPDIVGRANDSAIDHALQNSRRD